MRTALAIEGEWEVPLPYAAPPLSLNDRYGWQKRARLAAEVKHDTKHMASFVRLPRGIQRVGITLHYQPSVRRRRDGDNLYATLKPAIDGLVAYGLIEDDDDEHVLSRDVKIHEPSPGEHVRLWLIITDLSAG
jgi:crossover junction endodeoxyribonuclease RusA